MVVVQLKFIQLSKAMKCITNLRQLIIRKIDEGAAFNVALPQGTVLPEDDK